MKTRKKLPKKPNREKKPIKPIRILKKSTGSVMFYKPETEKTKPNLNRAKPEKNEPNRKTKPNRKKPNQTGLTRFRFFFFKIDLVIFF